MSLSESSRQPASWQVSDPERQVGHGNVFGIQLLPLLDLKHPPVLGPVSLLHQPACLKPF